MPKVSIVVSTYGDPSWKEKAQAAVESAQNQTAKVEVLYIHGDTLASARNKGAELAQSEWLVFLDADDTLSSTYVEEMLVEDASTLRQPATLGVYPDGSTDDYPVLIPERNLIQSNYLVIGSMCKREQFLSVGGFDPEFPVLEDWDLWIRMVIDGAIIGKRPNAIYRVGVNENSRNSNSKVHGKYYSIIRNRYSGRL